MNSRRRRVKRKGKTKTQVKDKLREAVADLEAGVTTDAGSTVQDAVTDFLQKGLKGRAKGTIDNYRSLADHNLIAEIGGIKVKELTADQLDDWMDERAEELSTRSLRFIPPTRRADFSYWQRDGLHADRPTLGALV